jgi:hypothetical protein
LGPVQGTVAAGTCLPSRYLFIHNLIKSRAAETTDRRESRLEKVRTTVANTVGNGMRIAETGQAVMRLNFNLEDLIMIAEKQRPLDSYRRA